jgi:SAM-dependent methyltransferase
MVLRAVLRDIMQGRREKGAPGDEAPTVLNVGGYSKVLSIPEHYRGWRHLMLDIDAGVKPDIVADARELAKLPGRQFDAVYCSHNLEHYHRHEGRRVLQGFLHVLKPSGFAEIRVPDLKTLMEYAVANGLDVDDVLSQSPVGPILVRDVIYGFSKEIEESGQEFFAHKTGFTASSLKGFLGDAGFAPVMIIERKELFELRAFAFRAEPTAEQRALLGL